MLSPWGSRADETGAPQPFASVPATDAEAPRAGGDDPLVEEIMVLAPTRLPEGRPPGDGLTVQIIDSQELRAMGARTLQEALQRIPGVHLADEQGNPHQMDLSLRGFSASPVTGLPQGLSLFVDGVRVNEPAAEEVIFELIPIGEVDRIEIVRGPNAIFGRNTLGGAIHIITRRGSREPEASVQVEGARRDQRASRGRSEPRPRRHSTGRVVLRGPERRDPVHDGSAAEIRVRRCPRRQDCVSIQSIG